MKDLLNISLTPSMIHIPLPSHPTPPLPPISYTCTNKCHFHLKITRTSIKIEKIKSFYQMENQKSNSKRNKRKEKSSSPNQNQKILDNEKIKLKIKRN